jgi:thiol:disulfide interchange protein DsbD
MNLYAQSPNSDLSSDSGLDLASLKSDLTQQNEYPTSEQAFNISAVVKNNNQIQVLAITIPNTYLYANSFKFATDNKNITFGEPKFPAGEVIDDEHYGRTKIFSKSAEITLPYQSKSASQQEFDLTIDYQGCLKDVLCYPPKKINVTLKTLTDSDSNLTQPSSQPTIQSIQDQNQAVKLLETAHIWSIIGGFIVFGLLLSLTPCVLPMLPIISGIIAGHKHNITKRHAFMLSFTYVFCMATTYMVAGILVAAAGLNLVSNLEHPIVIIITSLLFIFLAIASFGIIELKLPTFIANKLHATEKQQKGGTYLGVAIMGVLSALIISPCVTAPLAGALLYISSSGNIWLGGLALFCMGFAMGLPILIFGTSAGHWLPKAGPWMYEINIFFGVVFIGLAIYILTRLIPGPISLTLWAFLFIFYAVHLGLLEPMQPHNNWQKIQKSFALLLTIYGSFLLAGASQNNSDLFHPLGTIDTTEMDNSSNQNKKYQEVLEFTKIKDISELTKNLIQAKTNNQYTILTFYADWCVSCRKIDNKVFTNPKIKEILAKFKQLKVDLTDYNEQDKTLMSELKVFNPPTIIFYDKHGKEINNSRITSEINANELYNLLKSFS